MVQEERENIRRRQAEGIAVWRKTGKTKTGRPYGRPKIQFQSNWKKNLRALEREEAQVEGSMVSTKNIQKRLLSACERI